MFDDKRISEALELLNAVAHDNKAKLETAIADKYADLSSVINSFTEKVKGQAAERYEVGKQKVVDVATDIDRSVHKNPWAYIGGTAAAAIVFGFLLGRTRRD